MELKPIQGDEMFKKREMSRKNEEEQQEEIKEKRRGQSGDGTNE